RRVRDVRVVVVKDERVRSLGLHVRPRLEFAAVEAQMLRADRLTYYDDHISRAARQAGRGPRVAGSLARAFEIVEVLRRTLLLRAVRPKGANRCVSKTRAR